MGKRGDVFIHEFATRVMTEDGRVYSVSAYARPRGARLLLSVRRIPAPN